MATRVRSHAKVNLGLAIGPVRGDGFHGLATLYQTLALYDLVTVEAQRAGATRVTLTTNDARVPVDGRNTAWKMVERALERMGVAAEVTIHIEKELPVEGGMGAGSANAAAALIGLERELGMALPEPARLEIAAEVGSDVPLFLVGGAVLGLGRGERVWAMPELPAMACVVALPGVGVSTAWAFGEWDERRLSAVSSPLSGQELPEGGLTVGARRDRLEELSHVYASAFGVAIPAEAACDTSGIVRGLSPEKQQEAAKGETLERGDTRNDLAENTLLALVRTGVENDFEQVVFPQYPLLREIKHELMGMDSGSPALYAALSGSGSALFGLYRSTAVANAAQQRVQASGCKAILTETLPRGEYWRTMFAE
jgi:4-diphosphocytidyl-2-C-methyl-D-erythritol kinase